MNFLMLREKYISRMSKQAFSIPIKPLSAASCLLFLLYQQANADDFRDRIWIQGQAGLGYQQMLLNSNYEPAKNGYSFGAGALGEYRDDKNGAFGIGLGMRQISQQGSNNFRAQTYVIQTMNLDLSYLYPIAGQSIWVGAMFSNSIAPGALFDFSNFNQLQVLASVGPQVRVSIPGKYFDWVAGGQVLYALNGPSRAIWQVPVYAGISFRLFPPATNESQEAAPRSPASVEDPHKVKLNLDATLVQFEVNKTNLTTKSKEYLSRLAKALMNIKEDWESVVISGHTDASGNSKKNEILSQGRANSVRQWLIHEGLPAERLTAEGRGFQFLLPGLALNAPEHRRVELSFEGVEAREKLQNAIDGAREPKGESQ